MLGKKRTSLSAAPFHVALFVILSMAGILGLFWAYDEYLTYQFTLSSIRERYQKEYQNRLTEEMENVLGFVEYSKSQMDQLIEMELRDKVQIAYITASHLYSLYKDKIDQEELKSMIVEAIRPLRYDTGKGYYFIGRTDDGYIELNADRPEQEKAILEDIQDTDGNFLIREMIEIALQKGAGIYRYKWTKPEAEGKNHQKVSFVKYFSPFKWFIGSGVYQDDMQASMQEDILERLRKIHFGKNGDVSCFSIDGTILIDFDKMRSGRRISGLVDSEGKAFGKEMLSLAGSAEKKGFVQYSHTKAGTRKTVMRLSYVKSYPEWGWAVVTGLDMDKMEEEITFETNRLRMVAFRDIAVFVLLLFLAISIVAVIAYFHSLKIKHGIDLFTDFFKDAADKKLKLEDVDFQYNEFVTLGEFANKMVDERIEKEQIIHSDKLRLDTLLELGRMVDRSQQEISDFILSRMLEITRSERGYIAFINRDHTIVSLQSFLERSAEKWQKQDSEISYFANKAGFVTLALQSKTSVICNSSCDAFDSIVYPPEKGLIRNHLDVPIIDNDQVPFIAGVCNTQGDYCESDAGQLSLLLEGMWHHFLKTSSEKEMIRLRNLLKGINDSMPSVLICVDMNGRVMQWNTEAERVTGLSAKAAENRLLSHVFPRLNSHLWKIQTVIASGLPAEDRKVPYAREGETRYETITVYPLIAEQVTGAVIRIDDVTEKVYIEDLMIQSEKMLSVGGLAAGMAHEINNPLAGILQNLQVVQNRLSPDLAKNSEVAGEIGLSMEDIVKYLQKRGIDEMFQSINESAKRAAKLVLNMLSFSRKSDSSFSSQDLCEIMDITLELAANDYDLKKKYDFKNIAIEKNYGENIPLVPCEVTNIQQVFLNIIKNAAYALSEKAFGVDAPKLSIRMSRDDRMVTVEIADNGPGIDEKIRKRIFEPFFTTKPIGLGTGLGMSISYFIVHDQHKGTIEVKSEIGKGAAFIIRLPYQR
ncbi:MAG: cache domain-containing protein [Desulfoprunum sp.]|nr:cache domain-containing protein [Desulfoprunum sp.]